MNTTPIAHRDHSKKNYIKLFDYFCVLFIELGLSLSFILITGATPLERQAFVSLGQSVVRLSVHYHTVIITVTVAQLVSQILSTYTVFLLR